ncbi:MAG: STAS domain-containing protein [Cyanothece sp. SIO1E1]|nr:STAS domain-containing protein [Cyanothece sp. SIO1E1]
MISQSGANHCSTNIRPQVKIIQLSGTLDATQIDRLSREMRSMIHSGCKTVMLDCANVNLLCASGVGALLMVVKIAQQINAQVSICCLNQQARTLLQLTGMDQIFEIVSHL